MANPRIDEWHKLDLEISCPRKDCLAAAGEECKDTKLGLVHIGRRIKRLMIAKGLLPLS